MKFKIYKDDYINSLTNKRVREIRIVKRIKTLNATSVQNIPSNAKNSIGIISIQAYQLIHELAIKQILPIFSFLKVHQYYHLFKTILKRENY